VAALQSDPPLTQTPCHRLSPETHYPQQNPGNITPKPAWPIRNDHIQGLRPVQSNLLPLFPAGNAEIPLNLCHPSPPHSQLMQSLWQQLKITQTLINHLSSMILLNTTNHRSRTTSKNLFDLITELPMQPMALPTNLSHFPASKKHYLQAPSTGDKHWYQLQAQDHVPPRIKPLSILLQSILQFTQPYAKDLMKVP